MRRRTAAAFRRSISAAALTKEMLCPQPTSAYRNRPPKEELVFGTTLTDHMLIVEWEHGEWKNPRIQPYRDLPISPAASCLHYGELDSERETSLRETREQRTTNLLMAKYYSLFFLTY